MQTDRIAKSAQDMSGANMPDYDLARTEFDWETAKAEITGLGEGRLNIATEGLESAHEEANALTQTLKKLATDENVLKEALDECEGKREDELAKKWVEKASSVLKLDLFSEKVHHVIKRHH